jgi:hypothetical protein
MYIKKLLLLILIIFPVNTYWITFDSNISKISIKNNHIKFSSYISPSEIEYILNKNNIIVRSYEDHIINKDILKEYYKQNIKIKNCDINKFYVLNLDEYIKYIHTKWLRIDIDYICKTSINDFDFQINTFNDFLSQKYSITIYNLNKSNNKLLFKVLTKNNNSIKIKDLKGFKEKKTIDSDCDWLNDEEEKIYWTNILKQDTDWDNYSDYEEVKASLEPLNNILWPWQVHRDRLPVINCKTEKIKVKEETFFQKIISKILNFLKR